MMTALHSHRALVRRVGAGMVLVLAAVLGTSGPADARPIDQGVFHEEVTRTIDDYCGVPGLTVTEHAVFDGRFLLNTRQPGTAPYYLERATATIVVTDQDGDWVTQAYGALDKDLKITVNDDGTLTILVLSTGQAALVDSTGTVIARDPGQVRFELLVDYGEDVSDPSDDEVLDFLGIVKPSTGRSDDFCAATLQVLD